MSIPEEEWIPISALQHYMYCPRQFGLIHLEQVWRENFFTRDGKHRHERVDLPGNRRSTGRRVEYALPLASREYGLAGIADAVEFLKEKNRTSIAPVEYKRGGAGAAECDSVQLCAQVFCLEEMMNLSIGTAWLFYFETRSREEVPMTEELRGRCRETIAACHALMESGQTPRAEYVPARCRACSLIEFCMPPQKLRSCRDDFEEAIR